MANKITKKQKDYADKYLESGNGAEAAMEVYDAKNLLIAASISSQNLRKEKVREYLESKAEKVAEVVFNLAISSESDVVKLNASKDILDRSGYKPIEKSVNLNVEAEITNPHEREIAEKYEEELKKVL